MTPTFADLAKAQYILLTTFTKDGKPKPTPIWAALDKRRRGPTSGDHRRKVVEGQANPQHPPRHAGHLHHARPPDQRAGRGHRGDPGQVANGAVYDAIGKRYGIRAGCSTSSASYAAAWHNNVGLELKVAGS